MHIAREEYDNMIIKSVKIMIIFYSTLANGMCPISQNATAIIAVPPYERISSSSLTDDTIKTSIKTFLAMISSFALIPENAAISCKQIAQLRPFYESGYFWIQGKSGAVEIYCEMGTNNTFGESGGWMRIANVDIRNNQSQCPPELVYNVTEGRRLCRQPGLAPGCFSTTFGVQGVKYGKICGKVIGYQYFRPNGFGPSKYTSQLINETYVDGVSITYGSPRQHVWTFAAARDEAVTINQGGYTSCPCLHPTFAGVIPSFVHNDYYCETGSRNESQHRYYFDDPLWDGKGCEGENECCNRGGPWFCKQLTQPTQDDIEVRVCHNGNGGSDIVVIEQIKLYVQ